MSKVKKGIAAIVGFAFGVVGILVAESVLTPAPNHRLVVSQGTLQCFRGETPTLSFHGLNHIEFNGGNEWRLDTVNGLHFVYIQSINENCLANLPPLPAADGDRIDKEYAPNPKETHDL